MAMISRFTMTYAGLGLLFTMKVIISYAAEGVLAGMP
jgi:hypothetical protein